MPYTVSASQITTFRACQRKWAWQKIAHIVVPSHASAALGTKVHAQLESYLKGTGFDYSSPEARRTAEIALSGIEHLPEPCAAGMELERHFNFPTPEGVDVQGYVDVSCEDGSVVPGVGDDGFPCVMDHKTTSNFRYAKTPQDLAVDPQALIYAYEAAEKYHASYVDLVWVYYRTRGATASKRVHLRVFAHDVDDAFKGVRATAVQIADLATTRPDPMSLPPSLAECDAYGGCPFKVNCTDLHAGPLGHLTPEEENSMTLDMFSMFDAPPVAAPKTIPAPAMPAGITNAPDDWTPPAFLTEAPKTASVYGPINPPESALPPPPVVAAPIEEAKAKRTRRTKAQIAADEAAKQDSGAAAAAEASSPPTYNAVPTSRLGSDFNSFLEESGIKEECSDLAGKKEVLSNISGPSITDLTGKETFCLFVDCAPCGVNYTDAGEIFTKAKQKINAELKIADYRFADYGKGQGAFVVAACHFLNDHMGQNVVLDSRTPEGLLVLSDFCSRASLVVRGLR